MFTVCFVILLLLPSILGVFHPMHRDRLVPAPVKPPRPSPRSR